MIAPLTGLTVGMELVFVIAVDRFIAIFCPHIHKQVNKVMYLGSVVAACLGLNFYILYIGYLSAKEQKNTMVICMIAEGREYYVILLLLAIVNIFVGILSSCRLIIGLHGTVVTVWCIITVCIISGAVVIYIIIGIYIHHRIQSSSTTKKLYKSLFILCMIMMFSWVLACFTDTICTIFNISEDTFFFIEFYIGITINIACGSNFFVLTRFSEEYRTAAEAFFARFGIKRVIKSIPNNVTSSIGHF